MEEKKTEGAPETDAMAEREAKASRLLIMEDIRKYEQSIASLRMRIAQMEYYIAEARTALADVDRREAGVKYPEPPKKPEQADGGAEGK